MMIDYGVDFVGYIYTKGCADGIITEHSHTELKILTTTTQTSLTFVI